MTGIPSEEIDNCLESFVGLHQDRQFGEEKEYFLFGIRFLDEHCLGIKPTDLVVLSARTGSGKTEAALNIALTNAQHGKRVLYYALEGAKDEMKNRLLYKCFASAYFDTFEPEQRGVNIRFNRWLKNQYASLYRSMAKDIQIRAQLIFKNLFVFTRKYNAPFSIREFEAHLMNCHQHYDLIIVDHLQYFDKAFIKESEIEAIQRTVKKIRDMVDFMNKPILLVTHVRKSSQMGFQSVIPTIDDIFGHSDVVKVADKVIILGGARPKTTDRSKIETLIKIAKDRDAGYMTQYVGRCIFDISQNKYLDEFEVGKIIKGEFEPNAEKGFL